MLQVAAACFYPASQAVKGAIKAFPLLTDDDKEKEDAELTELFAKIVITTHSYFDQEAANEQSIAASIRKIVDYKKYQPHYDLFSCFPWYNEESIQSSLGNGNELLQKAGATSEERKEFFEFLYQYNIDHPIPDFYQFIKNAIDRVLAVDRVLIAEGGK